MLRSLPLPRLCAFALLAGALAGASPAAAQDRGNISISASVVKPLTLVWVQNLDLGSIALGPGTWSGAVIGISRAGTLSCASANLTCSGTAQVAKYQVTGTNNQVVRISAPAITLVNQSDPTKTLSMTIDSPGTVTLPNSGQPGIIFSLGGAITLSSTSESGLYSGTFNVTVDY